MATGTRLDFLKVGHRFPVELRLHNGPLKPSVVVLGEVCGLERFLDRVECRYQVVLDSYQLKQYRQYTPSSIAINFGTNDETIDVPLKSHPVIEDDCRCMIVSGVVNFS